MSVREPTDNPSQPISRPASARAFASYRGYVAAVARRMLDRSSDVDDVVQEVFLAFVESGDRIRDPSSLKAWLSTIARRQSRRQRAKAGSRLDADADAASLPSLALAPDRRAELRAMLERLQQLPRRLSLPFCLKHLEGESLPSIARCCNCSPSTVQRRIRRAESALQRAPRRPSL